MTGQQVDAAIHSRRALCVTMAAMDALGTLLRMGPWLAPAHDVGRAVATVHAGLGNAILWVAGVHAAAARYHQFVLKDRVLRTMLPL